MRRRRTRRAQPLAIRLTHWITLPALIVMALSGLQILRAYPYFGPRGARATWVPLQGWETPAWLRAGGWLAGARHLHFAMAWLLVVNAACYVGYLAVSGELRRRYFWPPRDARGVGAQLRYYLRRRGTPPPAAPYNGLQRLAYTGVLVLAIGEVLSGLVLYKPVQLHRLGWLMGGYEGARIVHFLGMLAIAAFVAGHVVMVALHPRTLVTMFTGGAREGDARASGEAPGDG